MRRYPPIGRAAPGFHHRKNPRLPPAPIPKIVRSGSGVPPYPD